MISFKDGFKRARKSTGLSQEKFADKFGFSLPSVKKWEQGKAVPEADTLALLCEIFECDMSYLFYQIDLPTHDLQFVHEQTGLTKDAINALKTIRQYNQTDWILDALNAILSADDFLTLLLYIVKYETSGDKEAKLLGQGESGQYSLKDIYQMKIFDILSRILTAISPEFENREDYRAFYRTILSFYRTPDKNGEYHSLDEFRLEIENAGLEFDPALFEGGRENG